MCLFGLMVPPKLEPQISLVAIWIKLLSNRGVVNYCRIYVCVSCLLLLVVVVVVSSFCCFPSTGEPVLCLVRG